MTDTNEAFIIIKPEGCETEKYQNILIEVRKTFTIKSAWGRMPDKQAIEELKITNKKCVCMILGAIEGQSLQKIEQLAKGLPIVYAKTIKEVAEQIAVWRPKFISEPKQEGEV